MENNKMLKLDSLGQRTTHVLGRTREKKIANYSVRGLAIGIRRPLTSKALRKSYEIEVQYDGRGITPEGV